MNAVCTTELGRFRHQSRRPAAFFAALVVYIIVILVAAPEARQQVFTSAPGASASPVRDAVSGSDIDLMVGRSTVLNVGTMIARVSLTVPDIADALVTGPTQLLVHGKQPGTISLFVWDKAGAIKTFEVKVRRDLSALILHLKQLFPGEDITVLGSGKDVVISGTVSTKYVMEKAAEVAGGYVEKKENVVNMLKQQEGVASNQVMLRVRFAEVSRSAMQELGATFFANGYKTDWFGRTAPPGVGGPDFQKDGSLTFSDFLNIFVFNSKEGLGGAVKALQTKGLFQSLAEPNLIASNGKEASFLAGGEYPYPVVQAGTTSNSITIMFKEFGIRLHFTPTVLGGDLIHLKVRPEVSALDFSNAVVLDDGQTFAVAGLMNNTLTSQLGKIPGIGDIPILGLLFKSKAYQKNQTELVVMITPSIIKKGQMGVSEGLPSLVEPYLGRPPQTYPNPDPYTGSPRYPADRPQPPEGNAPPKTTSPAGAPVPSKPISQGVPVTPAQPAPGPSASPAKPAAQTPARAVTQPASAPKANAVSSAQTREQKARAEEDRRQAEKLGKERAKREAEIARKNAEIARKQSEEDQKRDKALGEAAARLKEAQAAYQAEIEKTKGGSNEKPKEPGKGNSVSAPKH